MVVPEFLFVRPNDEVTSPETSINREHHPVLSFYRYESKIKLHL